MPGKNKRGRPRIKWENRIKDDAEKQCKYHGKELNNKRRTEKK